MALEHHLSNACRGTEVSVNLEGRVCVEEVGESASVRILARSVLRGKQTEHVLQDGERMGAVEHTCPEAYLPAETPSCGLVATVGQCLLGCREEFIVAVGANLVGGIQAV